MSSERFDARKEDLDFCPFTRVLSLSSPSLSAFEKDLMNSAFDAQESLLRRKAALHQGNALPISSSISTIPKKSSRTWDKVSPTRGTRSLPRNSREYWVKQRLQSMPILHNVGIEFPDELLAKCSMNSPSSPSLRP